jgi:hypothetical protein
MNPLSKSLVVQQTPSDVSNEHIRFKTPLLKPVDSKTIKKSYNYSIRHRLKTHIKELVKYHLYRIETKTMLSQIQQIS